MITVIRGITAIATAIYGLMEITHKILDKIPGMVESNQKAPKALA